ncbi:MAG: VgrG-related protein [Actinomycetota bacterium]|nr:VgrG-related protein [Actinomycetota bacterium]
MATQPSAGKFKIDIDGTALPDDVDHMLRSAIVDDNLNQPDMFILTFVDSQRQVLAKTKVKIGSKVKISAVSDLAPAGDVLLGGEVTALEIEHDTSGTYTIIRGYDSSHRLFRGRTTDTYLNVTYSDVAKKVAQRDGLDPGQIDSLTTVHPHVSQGNLNDWQFLQLLARDVGFEVAVTDGKLNFRKPTTSDDAPADGDLTNTSNPLQLTLGAHLLRLHSIVTSAEQVGQVEVRGWDPKQKKHVTASAPATTTTADIGVKPETLATTFGTRKMVGTSVPYATAAEVDSASKAMAEHLAGSFAEVEGLARGNSKLKAGSPISLSLLGDPFDGKYTLTSTRHIYDPHEGYTTAFTVSGRNQRSLLGLASGGGSSGPSAAGSTMAGVVPAIVTDVNDPEDTGRIKIKFPWISDTFVSDWARMSQIGAGNDRGAVFLPEVDDEVLVAFEQGDFRRPYVIGGLYNGVDKPKLGSGLIDGSSGAVKRRGLRSKHGHQLVFFDDDSKDGVALMTGDNNMRISLNKGTTTVKVTSSGEIKIEGTKDVSIKGGANMTFEATSKLSLKGASVEITGNSGVTVTGVPIKLN